MKKNEKVKMESDNTKEKTENEKKEEKKRTIKVVGTSNFMSMVLSERQERKKNKTWLNSFKNHILTYMKNTVSRGSKYIYREKMSMKNYEIILKKFKFTEAEIRRINQMKKRFVKIFEENIKEIFYVNPKTPAGFKNPKGPCLESDPKVLIGGNSSVSNRKGMRAVLKKGYYEQEFEKVRYINTY